MRVRNTVIVCAGAMGAVVATSVPTSAVDTVTTSTVTATTGLTISAPANATLSSAAPGGQATGALGNVTVNDQRSQLNTTWTATVSLAAPGFTTGAGTAAETIPGSNVTYDPGAAINPVNPPFTPGTAGTLAAPRTAFSRASGNGANSVSWNPTLTVSVPASSVSGDYQGTVTHSVA
ncbi:hypothetical protein [Streptomyces sp. TRM68367]|uniref:hypothetical protein n=1 Tax=Streptomyces sp. TRM68367 TaxID=2758415 RepID=UPI00165B24AE|nr:hypothetical protein [Streptomyces sp. TRM68367]MBC9731472.1 hypothetical protein [Streptomyces sp. TRM68367]